MAIPEPGFPDNPEGGAGGWQWEQLETYGSSETMDISEQTASQASEQKALQWQAVLHKLDPDDQALLLDLIAEEKVAAKMTAAAVAAQELTEKDSEIAVLRASLAADGATSWAEKSNWHDSAISVSHRQLTVSGNTYTALSALYSSTAGILWTASTNWMSADPCTAAW